MRLLTSGKPLGSLEQTKMFLKPAKLRGVVLLGLSGLGLLLLTALAGCSSGGSGPNEKLLVVFAAASLAEAFGEIADAFERDYPGVNVSLNLAGSQRLRTQLEHGASADVFASADNIQMDRLMASGLLLGQPVPFTTNRLVVIIPKSDDSLNVAEDKSVLVTGRPAPEASGETPSLVRPEGTTYAPGPVLNLEDMAKEGVKLVVALPEVPAGTYARTVIANIGADPASGPEYAERVLANVVSMEPNVRSVTQKVALGEADAGIVYWSDAQVERLAGKIRVLTIPERSNVVAGYPVACLRGSAEPELAEAFIYYLLSPQGQDILFEHGFGLMDAGQVPPADGTGRNNG